MESAKWVSRLFLYFCTALALFVTVSGFATAKNIGAIILQFTFLPITIFLVVGVFSKKTSGKTPQLGSKNALIIAVVVFIVLLALGFRNVSQKTTVKTEVFSYPKSQLVTDTQDKNDETNLTKPIELISIKTLNPQTLVNVREGSSFTSPIITHAKSGETYPTVSFENGWYEILLNDDGLTGWVHQDYITFDKKEGN